MRQLSAALLMSLVLAGCSLTPDKEDPVQLKLNDLDGRVGRSADCVGAVCNLLGLLCRV